MSFNFDKNVDNLILFQNFLSENVEAQKYIFYIFHKNSLSFEENLLIYRQILIFVHFIVKKNNFFPLV